MKKTYAIIFILLLSILSEFKLSANNLLKGKLKDSIVRITTTYQTPSFYDPWRWNPSTTKSGQGIVIASNMVLTLADNVRDARLIQVTLNSEPIPANMTIKAIDLNSNLALLEGELPNNAQAIKIPNASKFQKNDDISFFWKSSQGTLMEGSAILERIEARFPSSVSIQSQTVHRAIRSSYPNLSFGIPVFDHNDDFYGLALRGGAEYEFSILTTDIINRIFDLKTGEKKELTGIPGFRTAPLTQVYFRKKLGLTMKDGGCLISKVFEQGSGIKQLKPGDVLMEVDGKKLDAWGKYEKASHERIFFKHLFSSHYINESIPITIVRNKKRKTIRLKLDSISDNKWLIPRNPENKQTSYLIRGGFVFIPMTVSFLKEWGGNFMDSAPLSLVKNFNRNRYKIKNDECEDLVILARVLPHPSNIGLQSLGNTVIRKVNGKKLKSLKQLKKILDDTGSNVVKLSLTPEDTPLWLNPSTLKNADQEIQRQYGIFQLEHFTEDE